MYRNFADEATLAAAGATSGFPAAMLQDEDRGKLCRQAGDSLVITGQWSTPKTCAALILAQHNLSAANGTIRLQTDQGHDWTWEAWEPMYFFGRAPLGEGLVGGYPSPQDVDELTAGALRFIYFGPARFTSFTLTLTDVANPDGWVEAGRLFLGQYLEMAVQFVWGYGLGHEDYSQLQRVPSGAQHAVAQGQARRQDLTFEKIPRDAVYNEVLRWLRTVGVSKCFFIDPVPDGSGDQAFWHRMYCRRVGNQSVNVEAIFRGTARLTLEEAL
ncbi:MAG: hypothetical protein ACOZHQ_09485 [Thermodesulfobacteriota bacterium]